MKNTLINKEVIKKIALTLGELNNDVIYVGGATVSLYINDPAADDVRPTRDIDISLQILSIPQLEEIRELLVDKGFKQSADLGVICRFKLDDILIDVMSTKAVGWAPANQWFADGFDQRETVLIDEIQIQIMPLPYFLASKFSAFTDRGGSDPRYSKDFEDITYILNNRMDWHEVLINSEANVKEFLARRLQKINDSSMLQEAMRGNLFYEGQSERFKMIIEKIALFLKK
ncbi:nucleotidyl transferase AbiEii/AbiGii toxin family protein [Pricia sp.]|uniref:nucleotidyl transferase AbiEii/AbiGii toxin family protein n=1 Tax=Pricia sp. TaxID=2268138 RepID=UPI0035936C50